MTHLAEHAVVRTISSEQYASTKPHPTNRWCDHLISVHSRAMVTESP